MLKVFKLSNKISTIVFGVFFVLVLGAQTSHLHYKILHNGDNMGSLEASCSTTKDSITYESHTNIEYEFLATIRIKHKIVANFIDSNLESSVVESTIGKKNKSVMKTENNQGNYSYSKNGKVKEQFNSNIHFSVQKLFFVEPIGVSKVYSEEQGNFHSIKKIGDHKYLKTAPNGRESIYVYEGGILVKNDIDAGLISFEMILEK